MPKPNLRPYALLEEGMPEYLGHNFNRLEQVLDEIRDVKYGSEVITGSGTVPTGLNFIEGAIGALLLDASSSAAFVNVQAVPGTGNLSIRILDSSFVLSVIPVGVGWIAVGTLVLT